MFIFKHVTHCIGRPDVFCINASLSDFHVWCLLHHGKNWLPVESELLFDFGWQHVKFQFSNWMDWSFLAIAIVVDYPIAQES